MSNKSEKEIKRRLKIILLVIIGVVTFTISLMINIVGISQTVNNEPDTSGMVGLSIRKKNVNNNQKETKVDNDGKVVEEEILINSLPIIKLNNNSWDVSRANLSGFERDENGNMVFPNGYVVYCNGKSVYNVIFDSSYTGEIIGNFTVGTDFEKIEEKLGVPTFKAKDYIGYKTKEIYVFFYEDEVSVYPNRKFSNGKLEEFLTSYLEKTYTKGRTYFLADLRNNYEDFIVDIDEENDVVTIKSIERQVVGKLNSLGNIEIEFYNGYEVSLEETETYIKQKVYKTNEEDLVEIVENERKSSL